MKKNTKIEKTQGDNFLTASLILDLEQLKKQSFVNCMQIVDLELGALRRLIRGKLIDEIFTRGG